MKAESFSEFALSLDGATEDFPFGPMPVVYKVGGLIFAFLSVGRPGREEPFISLKCDPTLARALREEFESVTPGYHLNKKHWNSVQLDGDVPDDQIHEMVRHSYDQVLAKLPKSARERL